MKISKETDGKVIDDDDKSCAKSITLLRELSKEEIKQYFINNQERIIAKGWKARLAMAEQRVCLDKLINDETWFVRAEIAEQGYGLNKLIDDENEYVCHIARQKLTELNSTESSLI